VFRINKDEIAKETNTPPVKKRFSSSKRKTNRRLKKAKSQITDEQESITKKVFFNFSLPTKQNSAIYPSIQNHFNVFEKKESLQKQNSLASQNQSRTPKSTDLTYNLPKC